MILLIRNLDTFFLLVFCFLQVVCIVKSQNKCNYNISLLSVLYCILVLNEDSRTLIIVKQLALCLRNTQKNLKILIRPDGQNQLLISLCLICYAKPQKSPESD